MEAIEVCQSFKLLFHKYSKCHNLINDSQVFDKERLSELDRSIIDLMAYLRNTWPKESITLKLHLLEDHVLPFLKRWKTGLGVYGEQGGEGIHAEFNSIKAIYCRMPSSVARVHSILKEHYIRVHPRCIEMKPEAKKRKKIE
ncbi:uncharacterized protein LOC130623720 [Hydractinia symbiolongicarpus]|uniref:uncharacterized protein LOC130623720 n=1 Tax=Hydractinia symbiolongicarpus TaxID=13093 RepID=UPI00254EF897|nr:uncharacterized protein LOC130623720 [Hydractinia symbiolongicarpus]